jgi:hypothetical protein
MVGVDKSSCVYTLKNEDHLGYPSLYRLYMEANDPTEYKFAIEHLDGWDHWEQLCQCSWFQNYLNKWRRELEVRFKSRAVADLITLAKDSPKDAVQINKFLVSKGWVDKDKKGRPSANDIKKAAEEQASLDRQLTEDMQRIQGMVN